MDYTEVAIHVPPVYAESLAWHMREMGTQGVVVSEVPAEGPRPVDLAVKLYQPGNPEAVAGWLTSVSEKLEELKPHMPELTWRIETRLVPSEDWEDSWKRYWHPLEVGERIVIKPSWEGYDAAADKIVIELDPKQAFGTGTHATTQLCLRALETSLEAFDAPLVFDVGTGSGILAVAAVKLGARLVEACDTDVVAVQATVENATINGVVENIRCYHGGIEAIQGICDVLVINILAEVVADLAPEIAARVRPGGLVVASGIIKARQALVEGAFEAQGLVVQRAEHQGEWVVLEARKPEAPLVAHT